MIKNYLTLALKNFRKHKLFSIINLLGLTVGITCCLMIFLYVINEFSFDRFHKDGKYIYRVMRYDKVGNRAIPYLSAPYATALLNDYPGEIRSACRIMADNDLISYGTVSFNEKKIYLADSNFFRMFSFPLLKGDPNTVLNDPASIVLTAASAKKYFGNEDPMGKLVNFNNKKQFKVTGIAADLPSNTHLDFDMVVPMSGWRNDPWFNQWPGNGLFVYVKLDPAANPISLIRRFPAFMDKYLGKYYRENGFKIGLTLHALDEIHFENSPFDDVKHGNLKMVYIFMSIAVLILLIACINFMNLSTARANDRSREVGLRKVLGAVRRQLAGQFIMESLLFAAAATLLALGLLQLLMPVYEQFLGYHLPAYWTNPSIYLFIIGTIFVVGLLAGSYPALLLSSFSPIESLKGKLKTGKQGSAFRKILVVFQFGICVLLIVCISVVFDQLKYVRNTDLGFDKETSLIVRIDNGDIWNKMVPFKRDVQADPSVSSVSLMSGEPGGFHDSQGFEVEARPGDRLSMNTEFADFQYAKTLGLKFLAGRDFSPSFPTDSTEAVLINRTAASLLGYTPQQAIGKWIRNTSADSVHRFIIGVVEDYHYSSLKNAIGPLVISTNTDRRLALIKLKTTELPAAVSRIGKLYAGAAPAYPFEYTFLDERFNNLYQSELKQQSVLSIFSVVAICIACLGLFGLASYTAIKRTKEIGIRKVLGSTVQNIILLLSKDLLLPVLIGTLISIPAAWFIMRKWLEGFAYRVPFHWWVFAGAMAIAIGVALVTVSTQAFKAALANPVKSLRTE